jgi:nucleotide-binding universal stress UspA family protein
MTYTTVMLYIDADSKSPQLLRLGVDLARKFNAALIGISALAVRPPFVAEEVVIEGVTEAEIRMKLTKTEKWFRKIAGAEHQGSEWRSIVDFPTDALAREARSADLIVIGQGAGGGDVYSALDPAGLILKAGRPVLLVPKGVSSLQAEHVVIGWKETREARRTVCDALPFLHQATKVTIVEIGISDRKATNWMHVKDVARFLSRHNVNACSEVIVSSEESDSAQLVEFAKDRGTDLLVTGAYGHSRLGEWIFGGVTRDLLSSSPFSCLMSH